MNIHYQDLKNARENFEKLKFTHPELINALLNPSDETLKDYIESDEEVIN